MSEEALWRAMNKEIGGLGHFSRVESHETSAGIPDVDYCLYGVEGHIELKYGYRTTPKIRPSQIKWFRDRVKAKGHPWLFTCIQSSSGKYYMLHKGAAIGTHQLYRNRTEETWQHAAIGMWEEKMDWQALVGFLTINWSK